MVFFSHYFWGFLGYFYVAAKIGGKILEVCYNKNKCVYVSSTRKENVYV